MYGPGEVIDGLLSFFASCSLPWLGAWEGGVSGGSDNFDGPLFFTFFRFRDAIADLFVMLILRSMAKDGD